MKNGCRREGAAAKEKEIANNGKRQEVSTWISPSGIPM